MSPHTSIDAEDATVGLSESEERFRALVDAMPAIIYFATRDGNLTFLNKQWREYAGRSHGVGPADAWLAALHPEDRGRFETAFAAARERDAPCEIEFRLRRADGSDRWHFSRTMPVRTEGGVVSGWFGVAIDIDERRQAEERLGLALDAGAIMGTWFWDVPRDRVITDERFARAFGLDPHACRSGIPIAQALPGIHPEDRERVGAEIARALKEGGAYRCEYRVGEGRGRWIEAIGHVELSATGEPLRFPGIALDIEERRRVEAERDEATALLRAVVEAVPGAVYAKDRDGRVLLGNRGFAEAVGRSPGAFLGLTDLELLADTEQARTIMANDRRIMAAGRAEQIEEELRLPDGRTSYWISTKAPFRDSSGAVIGLVGSSVDISERRLAEERERLLAREIDHRSKNLLGVVQSILMLTKAQTVEEYRASTLARIHALGRVHSLLNAKRWSYLSLEELVRDEMDAFGRDDRIRFDGPDLRLAPHAAQALAMILHELATNAAKYGALSIQTGSVTITWTVDGGTVAVCWAENGLAGLEPPTSRGFGSTVVAALVERQLGGNIRFEWRAGGVLCVIEMPLDQVTEAKRDEAGDTRS